MSDITSAVFEAEQERCRALVHNDVEALDRLLDDRLSYIHASGFHEGKTGVISNLSEGRVRFQSLDWGSDRSVIALGSDAAIIAGPLSVKVNVMGKDAEIELLATCVWAQDSGAWKLVAFQSTTRPA